MIIKFKKLVPAAKTPSQAKEGDACWDITAVDFTQTMDYIEYKTGLAIEVPEDHVALLFPRSSITKKDLILKNSVGIIDSGYRGEITFRFLDLPPADKNPNGILKAYQVGDRIGQIMIIQRPFLEWQEVKELSDSERGTGGYGSSGS